MNIKEDCAKAWAEVNGYLDAVPSPAARIGIISGVGLVGFMLFLAFLPWSLIVAAGVAVWLWLRAKA